MAYLIALIPALGWGFMPLITGKVGGSEANQIFGIGAGASLVGLVAFLIMHPQVSMKAFLFSLLCGAPRDQTIEAVGLIIDHLRAEGYEFVTIEELNK